MKRDLKLCYLLLKQIMDSDKPYAPTTSIDGYSAEELTFNNELLKTGKYTYAGYLSSDDKKPCIKYNYITWQGVDFYEELKSKFETGYKPLGRSAPEDIRELLNYNIWKEIDKEECEKIMDCIYKEIDKKPFVVVSVTSGYNTINSVDYTDRFNSKAEADVFIKEREKERLRLYKDRKDYIEKYLISSDPGTYSLIKCRIGYADMDVIVSVLADTSYYDGQFDNYNPPKRIQSKGVDFVVELKEKSNV